MEEWSWDILENPCPSRPQVGELAGKQLNLDPTTRNPREINDEDPNKGIAATEVLKANNLEITDENIFIAASLKDKGVAFLKGDYTIGVRKHDPNAEKKKKESQDKASQNPPIMMFRLVRRSFKYILKMVVLSSMERPMM